MTLTVHHLWFTVVAATPIVLPPESGSAIRGALVGALRQHYCPDASLRPAGQRVEADAAHRSICPVCWLIAEEDAAGERGRNVPRPYTIEPPARASGPIEPGQELAFGVSLIGTAVNLFPYLVLAVPEMGRVGVGQWEARYGGRGRFTVRAVHAVNPLSGARQPLLAGGARIEMPAVPVTAAEIDATARALAERADAAGQTVEVQFRTPTRIVDAGRLVNRPRFGPLFQRLLERLEGLGRYDADPATEMPSNRAELLVRADAVDTIDDRTRWVEATSGSKRLGRTTPVSGYEGRARFRASDWAPLLPTLLWGQSVHVGKNAVKGDGWYTLGGCPGWPDGDA